MTTGFFLQNVAKGGLDTFIINLMNGSNGKEKILFCNDDHPGIKNLIRKTKTIKKIFPYKNYLYQTNFFKKKNIAELYIKKFLLKCFKFFLFLYQIYKFKKIFKAQNLDKLLVISGGYPGGKAIYAAVIAYYIYSKKKCLICFHANPRYNFYDKLDIFQKLINFCVSKITKNLIFPSYSCQKSYKKIPYLNEISSKVISNGINFKNSKSNFNIRKQKKKLRINVSDKVISVIGIIEKNKGQYFALEVFEKVIQECKNVHLIICGNFNKKYKFFFLKKLSNSKIKKKITLIPFVNNISTIYKLSDIIFIPSQEKESFSYVALEATKYKIPVIATKVGGLPEIIRNNVNGFIIDSKNTNQFIKKILYLLNNKFRVTSNTNSKKFDYRYMTKQYEKALNA